MGLKDEAFWGCRELITEELGEGLEDIGLEHLPVAHCFNTSSYPQL